MSPSSNATRSLITRQIGMRVASAAAAAVLAGSMLVPGTALAADMITVEGNGYFAENGAASGSGSGGGTWSWDGADDMKLNDYVGGSITADGTLNVDLTGTNVITADTHEEIWNSTDNEDTDEVEGGETKRVLSGLSVSNSYDNDADEMRNDGDLTITGSGSLEVKAGADATDLDRAEGISASGGVVIDGATVTVTLNDAVVAVDETIDGTSEEEDEGSASAQGYQVGISAVTLTLRNGASVTVTSTGSTYTSSYIFDEDEDPIESARSNAYGISLYDDSGSTSSRIDNSTLTVNATSSAFDVNGGSNLTIGKSTVALTSDLDTALYVSGDLTIDDSDIVATSKADTAIWVNGTLHIDYSDVDANSPEDYYAVLASKIQLSRMVGDTTVSLVWEDEDGTLYTLGKEGEESTIKLRRAKDTPASATAKADAAESLAQTSDSTRRSLVVGLAAAAIVMFAAGAALRRREQS